MVLNRKSVKEKGRRSLRNRYLGKGEGEMVRRSEESKRGCGNSV